MMPKAVKVTCFIRPAGASRKDQDKGNKEPINCSYNDYLVFHPTFSGAALVRPRLYGNVVDNALSRALLVFCRNFCQSKSRKDFSDYETLQEFALRLLCNLPMTSEPSISPWQPLLKAAGDYIDFYQTILPAPVRRESLAAFLVGHLHGALNLTPRRGDLKSPHRSYFTPAPLAYLAWQSIVKKTDVPAKMVAPAVPGGSPLIVDPACGSGSLLLAALDGLERQGLGREAALACLRGFDIDDKNLRVAILVLAVSLLVERQSDRTLEEQLSAKIALVKPLFAQRDGLAERTKTIDADIVLLNPPWQMDKERGSLPLLFLKPALDALSDGRVKAIAFISPASILSDLGASGIRRQLLEQNLWRSLSVFVNRDRAFAIHPDFRYCLSIFAPPHERHTKIDYGTELGALSGLRTFDREQSRNLPQFSPEDIFTVGGKHLLMPRLEGEDSLSRLQSLARSNNVCSDVFDIGREFDLTLDRSLFFEMPGQDLLPLIEGRMLGPFSYNAAAYVRGQGRSALWLDSKEGTRGGAVCPQYFLPGRDFERRKHNKDAGGYSYKIGVKSISGAANKRTVTAAVLDDLPCANSVTVLRPRDKTNSLSSALLYCAIFNSDCFNEQIRSYLQGNNLNYFLLSGAYMPDRESLEWQDKNVLRLVQLSLSLCLAGGLKTAAIDRLALERNLSPDTLTSSLEAIACLDWRKEIESLVSSLYKRDFPYIDFLAKVNA